jgi:hypothetical protein
MKKLFERLIKRPSRNVPDTFLASPAESPFTAAPAPQLLKVNCAECSQCFLGA